FHVQRSFHIFSRRTVSEERLNRFEQDPLGQGPKRRNTWLDKRGLTPAEIVDNRWNQAVILMLSTEAEYIFAHCTDGRFGYEEPPWSSRIRERLLIVARDILGFMPKTPDES
ncbi:hypothetical protein K435DRAFT_584944, partial [Dendrothele bispora CBS 962.96]